MQVLSERIKLGLEVSPSAEGVKDALPILRIDKERTSLVFMGGGSHI